MILPMPLQELSNWTRRYSRDAATVSGLLGDLVSLATAQVYGSTQLTIGTDASGNFNKSDVMVFMKNIGVGRAQSELTLCVGGVDDRS